MRKSPSPDGSVERYGAMAAALGRPFADRDAILRDAGLTDDAWLRVDAAWRARITQDREVATGYHEAFKRAVDAIQRGHDPRIVASAPSPVATPPVVNVAPVPPPVVAPSTPSAIWNEAPRVNDYPWDGRAHTHSLRLRNVDGGTTTLKGSRWNTRWSCNLRSCPR